MIAVFCKSHRFFEGDNSLLPKSMFKQIVDIRDIRGQKFTGVILGYKWWERNHDIEEAYDALTERQPELFE